jgi:hypothetical protein
MNADIFFHTHKIMEPGFEISPRATIGAGSLNSLVITIEIYITYWKPKLGLLDSGNYYGKMRAIGKEHV